MPIRNLRPLGVALACAIAVSLIVAVPASAEVTAELRVLTPGKTLESGTSYVTGTESIRTDPKARCFIGGSGGSGDKVRLRGATGLGLAISALDTNEELDPISVTDEFGFGLGVCGFGGKEGNETRFWTVLHNHQDPGVGGDQVELDDGDQVTWYRVPSFPTPPELELQAPAGSPPGPIGVHVVQHTCTTDFPPVCSASNASGATVSGASGGPVITNASGNATINQPGNGTITLQATRGSDIRSAPVDVCVDSDPEACPDEHGKTIIGRSKEDGIKDTPGWDLIKARGDDDRINIRKEGQDKVKCGGGRDKVIRDRGDKDDVLKKCERVVKK